MTQVNWSLEGTKFGRLPQIAIEGREILILILGVKM
jgi:hypothetical protein